MIQLLLAGVVVTVLVYNVAVALLDPEGKRLSSIGF
jgi:hypothetical protein